MTEKFVSPEIPDSRLYAHHVLHAVRFTRDDVRAAQVDIADLRGERICTVLLNGTPIL